jgi:hypothetical protein
MALANIKLLPGFDKTETPSGAEGKWIDGDFVRFRYGQPEKIGGFVAIGEKTISGPARAQHTFTDLEGRKYAAIGTSKLLLIYYGGEYFDITPLATALTGATFTSSNGSSTVTINKTSHGFEEGDYFIFSSVTLPGGGATTYVDTDFTTNTFEVTTASTNSFTVTMPSNEGGTGMSAGGSTSLQKYETIGPILQTAGYGWGTGVWGGSVGSIPWGQQTTSSTTILDPGSWSLDNFGEILTATIRNGKTFTWDAGAANPTANRATIQTSAPTKSILTAVSDRDRHFVHFGTETIVGDPTKQDPMFIRFSDQENFNDYEPTSVNTAGTFRLDKGNTIVTAVSGKDYILVLTDQAAYTMQFVGPPFTFSIRQVGTNCGCIGQHAAAYADGKVYWMGLAGGFFVFDGTVKNLPSLVEDFVFQTDGDNLGVNYNSNEIIYASHNSLYSEIIWFYPKGTPVSSPSTQIDRAVVYNYRENTWSTMSLARSTYADSITYENPQATEYDLTGTPQFPTVQGVTNTFGASTLFQHENGVNKVDLSGASSAISAFVLSGDFDIDLQGDGQFLLNVRRFLPDFKNLQGNCTVTLGTKNFPTSNISTNVSFVVTGSTSKIDTRVRGRLANLKIENSSVGDNWRFGTFRADVEPDGRR